MLWPRLGVRTTDGGRLGGARGAWPGIRTTDGGWPGSEGANGRGRGFAFKIREGCDGDGAGVVVV